jgi:hypothetical protein
LIIFKSVSYKNFLSTGNVPNKIELNTHNTTLTVGKNSAGKCLDKLTNINIHIDDLEIRELFTQFNN